MLKLVIADDERIIRETISSLIDWNEHDIELVGLCKNGLEAYDTILDESPDIVLTDIRMPGIDGLELIQRISATDLNTQFIILSGYGEFEYAKTAMKYGVKHYLLKPCNEIQILECIQELAQERYRKSIAADSFKTMDSICHNVMFSILNDAIYQKQTSYKDILRTYDPYMDFYFSSYHLIYVYFLEQENLNSFLETLQTYAQKHFPQVTIHGIYVSHTLLLFFRDFAGNYHALNSLIKSIRFPAQNTSIETEELSYRNLESLLSVILDKVKRFSMIYYINNFHVLSSCNYSFVMEETESLCNTIQNGHAEAIDSLIELISAVDDLAFLKQLANSLILKITAVNTSLSTIELTEWLLQASQENDIEGFKLTLAEQLRKMLHTQPENNISSMTQQIWTYVEENLANSNITLKLIAEQYLFMNTDYVSKKFQKETGTRFSNYLTDVRIKKAKQLLLTSGTDKIQNIAEEVGLGNNPQYFSQLFKKKTGLTPSAYLAQYGGKTSSADSRIS